MKELEDAAKSAGLVDLDLLKLVTPGKSPTDAIAELMRLYPGAFHVVDVRRMSRAEFMQARKDLMTQSAAAEDNRRRAHIEAEMAKPSVRDLPRAEAKRRLDEYLRGLY